MLGQLAGELAAGRAGAHQHEREQLLARGRVVFLVGLLEGADDAAPQELGVCQRLHARRQRRPFVVTEVAAMHARRQDQVVVGDRLRSRRPAARVCGFLVDAGDLGHAHVDVLLADGTSSEWVS